MTVELHCVENRSSRSSLWIRFVKTEVVEVLDLKGLEIWVRPIGAQVVMHQYGSHIRIDGHLVEDGHGPALGDAQYLPLREGEERIIMRVDTTVIVFTRAVLFFKNSIEAGVEIDD